MKKLIALLLAVLLLGTSAAFAETAAVLTISDPRFTATVDGETVDIDLNGLTVTLAPVDGDTPGFALNIADGDRLLLAAAVVYADGALYFRLDGMESTYYLPLDGMPSAQAVDLSGIDYEALTEAFVRSIELRTEGDTTYFTVPYTAFNELFEGFEQLLLYEDADDIRDPIENDYGVGMEGFVTARDDALSLEAELFGVEQGQALTTLLSVYGGKEETAEGTHYALTLAVSDYDEFLTPVFTLDGTVRSDASGTRFSFTMAVADKGEPLEDVLAAEGSVRRGKTGEDFSIVLYTADYGPLAPTIGIDTSRTVIENGSHLLVNISVPYEDETLTQVLSLDASAVRDETGAFLYATLYALADDSPYLVQAGTLSMEKTDTFTLSLDLSELGSSRLRYDPADGLVQVEGTAEGVESALSFRVRVGEGAYVLPALDRDSALNFEAVETDEQAYEQFTNELYKATAKLTGYLYPILVELGVA